MAGNTYEEQVLELVSRVLEEHSFRITSTKCKPEYKFVDVAGLKVENARIFLMVFTYRRGTLEPGFYFIELCRFRPEDVLRMDEVSEFPVDAIWLPKDVRRRREVELAVSLEVVRKDIITLLEEAKKTGVWEHDAVMFKHMVADVLSFPPWLYNDMIAKFLLGGLMMHEGV